MDEKRHVPFDLSQLIFFNFPVKSHLFMTEEIATFYVTVTLVVPK